MTRLSRLSSLAAATLLAACGGFDGSATQKMELKGGDIEAGTISTERELDAADSTWEKFLADAKTSLGADATSLSVNGVKFTFDAAKAKNAGKFEDIIKGDVILSFKIKDTSEIVDIAKITDPTGSGSVDLTIITSDLTSKKDKLKQGQFKVGVRGSTAKAKGDDFTLPFVVTFDLTAK